METTIVYQEVLTPRSKSECSGTMRMNTPPKCNTPSSFHRILAPGFSLALPDLAKQDQASRMKGDSINRPVSRLLHCESPVQAIARWVVRASYVKAAEELCIRRAGFLELPCPVPERPELSPRPSEVARSVASHMRGRWPISRGGPCVHRPKTCVAGVSSKTSTTIEIYMDRGQEHQIRRWMPLSVAAADTSPMHLQHDASEVVSEAPTWSQIGESVVMLESAAVSLAVEEMTCSLTIVQEDVPEERRCKVKAFLRRALMCLR